MNKDMIKVKVDKSELFDFNARVIYKIVTKMKVNKTDIPMVQGKNIRNGLFVEEYDWYISKDISDKLIRSKLTKECILIPYVGSNLGEVGIFYHPYDCHLYGEPQVELDVPAIWYDRTFRIYVRDRQ
jgi:hypothetical protein